MRTRTQGDVAGGRRRRRPDPGRPAARREQTARVAEAAAVGASWSEGRRCPEAAAPHSAPGQHPHPAGEPLTSSSLSGRWWSRTGWGQRHLATAGRSAEPRRPGSSHPAGLVPLSHPLKGSVPQWGHILR